MMKEIWLIYRKDDAKRNQLFIQSLIEEGEKLNIQVSLKYREQFYIGVINGKLTLIYDEEQTELPAAAIVRVPDPFFSEQLEAIGIRIFNRAKVSALCNDKRRTHQALAQLHIPMVDTLFFNIGRELSSKPPLSYPLVIKGALGRSGAQVFFIQHQEDWESACEKLANEPVVVQRPAERIGKDLRVFIIGKNIIGAVLRYSESDFKANFTLGGQASRYELSQEERQLINSIIAAFDFDFVGIDFLFDGEGNLLFNEIEDVVGSRTLYATSNVNVAKLYVKHIAERIS